MGEAKLMLGSLDDACGHYIAAQATAQPREHLSMAAQAMLVANRIFGKDGAKAVGGCFGLS